jgi:hypothetical protein
MCVDPLSGENVAGPIPEAVPANAAWMRWNAASHVLFLWGVQNSAFAPPPRIGCDPSPRLITRPLTILDQADIFAQAS